MQKKHKGFTLIELMVTIAIMAVIAAIAAPSFQAQIYNYELKRELNELAFVLNEAKASSKALNQTISVFFRAAEPNDPANSLYLDPNKNKYEFNMEDQVILFRNNGVIDPSVGNFPLCFEVKHMKSGKTKNIELTQLGMQKITDGACTRAGS